MAFWNRNKRKTQSDSQPIGSSYREIEDLIDRLTAPEAITSSETTTTRKNGTTTTTTRAVSSRAAKRDEVRRIVQDVARESSMGRAPSTGRRQSQLNSDRQRARQLTAEEQRKIDEVQERIDRARSSIYDDNPNWSEIDHLLDDIDRSLGRR